MMAIALRAIGALWAIGHDGDCPSGDWPLGRLATMAIGALWAIGHDGDRPLGD